MIVIEDPNLLLFYQNRLVPFAEALATAGDAGGGARRSRRWEVATMSGRRWR
jgi:hypothetical protein